MPNYIGQDLPIPAPALPVETMSAVQRARASMFADSAEGRYLSVVGQNYGVPRPQLSVSDETYSKLVQLLAWQPKTILFTLYKLLEIVFGSQAQLLLQGQRPWRVYEVNANEIIIELATSLIVASNDTASYMHGWFGYARVTAGGVDTLTCDGDATTASSATLVGRNLYYYNGSVWVAYTVSAVSYSSITGLSTIQVNAATLTAGGGLFYIDIPGDDSASARGDFLASSGFTSTFTTGAGPTADIVVHGDATQQLNDDHEVALIYGGVLTTFTIDTIAAYDTSTNTTTITMTSATIPGGLTNGVITRVRDVSDVPGAPDHADRVYLTALGAYEIVSYYLDLLVRASGIVVRLEQV